MSCLSLSNCSWLGVITFPFEEEEEGGNEDGTKLSLSGATLNTIFMLFDEHPPPTRRCKSLLDDVDMK